MGVLRKSVAISGAICTVAAACLLACLLPCFSVRAQSAGVAFRLRPATIQQALQDGSGKHQLMPCLLDSDLPWVVEGKRDPLCRKGLQLLFSGQWSDAAQLFQRAALRSPKNAALLEYRALALYMKGTFGGQNPATDVGLENIDSELVSESARLFDRAAQLQPECGVLFRNSGMAVNAFNRRHALALMRKAVSLSPKDPRCLLVLGSNLSHRGEYAEALALFERGLALAPDGQQFLFNLANTMLSAGRYKESIKYYDRLLAIEPNFEIGYYERGIAGAGLGFYKKAISDFDRAITLNKNYADAYDYRALVRGSCGDYEGAIADFRKAIQCDPTAAYFHSNLAMAYLRLARNKEALKEVDTAIRLGERLPGTFVCKGLVLASLGNVNEALKTTELALQMEPNNSSALQLRGRIFEMKGDYEQAVIDFDNARKLLVKEHENGKAAVLHGYGTIVHKIDDRVRADAEKAALAGLSKSRGRIGRKQIDETVRVYSKLIAMNPKKADLYYERATVHMIGDAYNLALRDFNTFASFRPQGDARTTSILLANICLQKLGRNAEGRELVLKESKAVIKSPYLKNLVQFVLGNLSEGQLLSSARSDSDRCYSYFYIAMKYRSSGDLVKTGEFLEKLLATNMYEMNEYQIGLSALSKEPGR